MGSPILQYHSGFILAKLDKRESTLVNHVCFEIGGGETFALIGETGSGKTMIAQSVMGVLPDNVYQTEHSAVFCGKPLPTGKALRSMLGIEIVYIPQNGHEFLNPSRTVLQHMQDSLKKLGIPKAKQKAVAAEKLRAVGFPNPHELLTKYPFQLSGGMAQRVTIALALCSKAKLLIADEPTNGLDPDAKKQFLNLLRELFPDAGKLIITHDISVAAMCQKLLVLFGGRMMETGAATQVLSAPKHPYTKALLGALVENGMLETPTLRSGASVCPFYERCPQALAECMTDAIPLREEGERKWRCLQSC